MAPSRLSEQLGRVVSGRYRLIAPIGAGASAQVFVADDVRLARQVAVKVLRPELADDERFLRRFRAEAQAAAALNHPNIVVVHDWGEDEVPFLVMEYLEGGSLRSVLDTGHRLDPSQALLVGLEACRGLAYAHARSIFHRDIKPANLLFGADGRLRVADFGLARALAESGLTEPTGAVTGTARYASPEQARGGRVEGKGDVYSLGLVLIEAVAGQVPFASDTVLGTLMARVEGDVAVPDALGPLRPALERAGRLRVDERPDAEELGIALLASSERLPAPRPLPLAGALAAARLPTDTDPTALAPAALPLDLGPARVPTAAAPATGVTAATATDRTSVLGSAPAAPAADATSASASAAVEVDEEDEPARPHRRRRWLRVLVAAVLVALLGAGGAFAAQAVRTPTHEVPELAGRALGEVELVADQSDWEIDVKHSRRDGTEPGEVLSTQPPAGERLAEGETLVVVVSDGNTLTALPPGLEGATIVDAQAALEAAGLRAETSEAFHEQVPEGTVISVGPVPAQLPKGEEIPLVVSKGPEPRTIPTIDGTKGYDAVAKQLQALGLVPARVDVFDDRAPVGHVLAVSPAPGTRVPRGARVELRTSKGPELVPVPDIRGKRLAEARAALQAAGLVLGQQCCRADGTVVASDPPPGTKVRKGAEVDVFLGG